MKTDWLHSRRTQFTAYATVYVLIILGVLGLVNWLANRYNKSLDTTATKKFSLSDQTKKVVSNLQQDVKITYFDKSSNFAGAKDLLDRYDTLSPKLKVEYVDPVKNPQLAKAMGAREYGSTFVTVGAKQQEAKSVTEEEVTGALIRVLKGGERNVCFVTGSGEHTLDDSSRDGLSRLKELMERSNYKTRSISLIEKPEVPKDCTVVAVAGPKFDYVQPVVDALQKYVEGGGRAWFLVDPPVDFGKEKISENAALMALLGKWGVTPEKDLVLDLSGMGQLFGFNAAVPLVSTYETSPIVRDLKGVATAFPLARSLDVKNGEKTVVEKLFSTTENSFATTNLKGSEIKKSPNDKPGPLVLGASGTYNTGQPNQQGRFIVVGSSSFVGNGILGFNGNRDLAMNMLNWLSSDEDLISIRPKDQEDRRLVLTKAQMNTIFATTVVLLPLMSILAGVGVWWRRR